MSREDFRSELRDAFESMSGPPSPSLSARVHDALVETPSRRGPIWVAGLAAAMIALIVVGALFIAGPLSHRPNVIPGVGVVPTPNVPVTPSVTTTPVTSPVASPTPDTSQPFICTSPYTITAAQAPQSALVDAVRTGTHAGYDRLTIEFQNGQPVSIELRKQANTTFTQGASGQQVVLAGGSGILVTIHGADGHTAYSGPSDFKTGYKGLVEARQVQDFEGVVQWGLGISGNGCYRAFILASPTRLVIDIQTS